MEIHVLMNIYHTVHEPRQQANKEVNISAQRREYLFQENASMQARGHCATLVYSWPIVSVKLGSNAESNYIIIPFNFASRYNINRRNSTNTCPNFKMDT